MTAFVGAPANYSDLALRWTPESRLDHRFKQITWTTLILMLTVGFVLSIIDVPESERRVQAVVPERIAQFIIEKEKVKEEKPRPEPSQPEKKVIKEKPKLKEPVTEKQKQARDVAEKSGVLALREELSSLMDTSEVSSMLGAKLSRSSSASQDAATYNREQLFENAEKGSGGISSDQYTSEISSTQLSDYQLAKVKQTLGPSEESATKKDRVRKGNVRTREDIAIVFDRNKSGLYSSYNRARRKNPGLKGKIVLEITISPGGKVTNVRIISSELNDTKLESRIVARIKTFDFGAEKVETITVTYPIEFLPS